jgi:tetratricopeptide (TPR) repeat protein
VAVDQVREDDWDVLISVAVRVALRNEDANAFLAWAVPNLPGIAPGLFAESVNPESVRGLSTALARALWNAIPLPSNRYRPRPLPEPGRNDPCFCGSGVKYKHCCGGSGLPPLQIPFESTLAALLEMLPAARLRELPHEQFSPEVLGHVASEWVERGEAARAIALLEPLFADLSRLDARAELAFDVLADAYFQLQRPKKKAALIERMIGARDPVLRTAALQRQCVVLADLGRYDEAWRLFAEAQRTDPDHPAFAHLEIMLLLEQGRTPQAVERARFWAARLRRRPDPERASLLAFLDEVCADPYTAMMKITGSRSPALTQLQAMVAGLAPPVQNFHTLRRDPDNRAVLALTKEGQSLVAKWRKQFPPLAVSLTAVQPEGPFVWDESVLSRWLGFLERTPAAFDAIEVLDDLVLALHQLPDAAMTWVQALVAEPLLQRAVTILDSTLAAGSAGTAEVPWLAGDNRPALRLLANLIYLYVDRADDASALPLLERMVFTLNPNDNHGLREMLARLYLRCGDDAKVLALAARYPEDHMVGLEWSRVLALYRLGRSAEADTALASARRHSPTVYRFLCADKVAQPRLTPGYLTHGGRDEAWHYRELHLALWRASGALEWLRASSRKTKPKAPDVPA